MKYIKQLVIIVGISLVGELLKHLLPLPIPASIYAVCGSDDRSHQTGIGEGDGKVSDRDHAGHVYSGRGRLVDQLGYIMRDPRPHRPDHCCDNSYRDGSHRLGISDHDTKGR